MKDTNEQNWINKETSALKKEGLYINIRTLNSPLNGNVKINGYNAINFSSNNYLGLANNNSLKNAAKKAIDKYGISSAAVRTIAGTTKLHNKLETKLANFKKVQSVITLQSGYAANIATIPAIVGKNNYIFSDELNHASIIDGCRLSGATIIKYKHLTADDLENKIKNYKGRSRKLIATDGVFSMNGDIAPLDKLAKIAHKYKAVLMVDDAHGEGVLGKHGRGIVDHFKLHGQVDLEIGTMSKAFGVIGGYVAGNKGMIEWLKQRARTFLFSSAMTVPDTAACIAAVNILQTSDAKIRKLWKNTQFFKSEISKMGFDTGSSKTPIIPIMLGEANIAQEFSAELLKNGVFAMSIGYPTVPKGKARVRVILSASHTRKDLTAALEIFRVVGKKLHILYK